MRITFLAPHDSLNGGVRVVALYARLLQARGHSVHIVSSPRPRPTLREHARALRYGSWQELRERHRALPGHLAQSGVSWHTLNRPRPIVAADVPDADVVIATWWEASAATPSQPMMTADITKALISARIWRLVGSPILTRPRIARQEAHRSGKGDDGQDGQ